MRWAEILLEVPPPSIEPASAVLTESGCAGVAVTDPNATSSDPFAEWIVRDGDPPPSPGRPCTVAGYLPVDDRLEAALSDIQQRLDILRDADVPVGDGITLRMVDDQSWAEAWKAHFKPLRVGRRFVIKPSWEEWPEAPGDRIIEIDPGMAFGSGSHPTTRLCLTLLEETVVPGERILDWGTGSGILAIGCARLGAREVLGVDLDPVAVRVAADNAARNGLSGVVRTEVASIEAVAPEPSFDRVVANIVADPIIQGAGEIARHLRPGGQAIISGIIERREPEVRQALEAAGLTLSKVLAEEDWRALLVVLQV